jgi:hypothetical protein
MDTPVDSTAMSWFPRIYICHFLISGNVFPIVFPSNGSICHNIVVYLLKATIVVPEKQPLLGNART